MGGVIGIPEWLPNEWAKRFGSGSVPVADADVYETKLDALEILRDAQARITQAVNQTDDSRLDEPFPDESCLDVFPTIRHALTQVLVGHTEKSHWTSFSLGSVNGLAADDATV